jgi:menaquinone-dependent protoporphyrinogen oxidase
MENRNSREHPLCRRSFLAMAGGVVGTVCLGDLSRSVMSHAAHTDSMASRRVEGAAGGKRKILVTYATMHGSTGEVADAIARALCDEGASVDVRIIEKANDLEQYHGVVVGSAIRSDRWLPEAKGFVERNSALLSRIPTAYFLTCLTLAVPSSERLAKAQSFLDPVLDGVPQVKPVSTGLFAGVLDYSKYPTTTKAVMKYMMRRKGVTEGDYRDWPAIRHWADQLDLKVP